MWYTKFEIASFLVRFNGVKFETHKFRSVLYMFFIKIKNVLNDLNHNLTESSLAQLFHLQESNPER